MRRAPTRNHGLRRTNADKRRSVLMLLEDPEGEWSQWSDRKIAEICGVDHKTVAAQRSAIWGNSPDGSVRLVERAGAVYEQKAKSPAPAAAPEVETDSTRPEVIPTCATAPDSSAQVPGPVTSSKPAIEPPPADKPIEQLPADEDEGPDEAELAALAQAEADEQAAIQRLLASDDKLTTVYAENKQLRAEIRVLRERLGGFQNKSDEQIRIINMLRAKLKKLEQPA